MKISTSYRVILEAQIKVFVTCYIDFVLIAVICFISHLISRKSLSYFRFQKLHPVQFNQKLPPTSHETLVVAFEIFYDVFQFSFY